MWPGGRLLDLERAEKKRLSRERAASPAPPPPPPADEVLARAETRARVAQAVLELPEPYRSASLLRYFEGMPPRRIAARQGVGVATAKTRLERARARLRQLLKRAEGGGGRWRLSLLPLAGFRPLVPWLRGPGGTIMAVHTLRSAALPPRPRMSRGRQEIT